MKISNTMSLALEKAFAGESPSQIAEELHSSSSIEYVFDATTFIRVGASRRFYFKAVAGRYRFEVTRPCPIGVKFEDFYDSLLRMAYRGLLAANARQATARKRRR